MIAKDKDTTSKPRNSRAQRAGHNAEKQMAFYLRRRFAESPLVHIFNDLRIKREGEVAQMDHLILHRHGLIVVESKSVTGEIQINNQLEFIRVSGRKRAGMPSPIQQAKRQAALLKRLLTDHEKDLLPTSVIKRFIKQGFDNCPIQVLVAISDQGIIKRPRHKIPELHKADQIVDQISSMVARHRKGAKLHAPIDRGWGMFTFNDEMSRKIVAFLLQQHSPPCLKTTSPEDNVRESPEHKPSRTPSTQRSQNSESKEKALPRYLCTHCHATNLEIRYGRSYYFKCLDCDGNTAIKNECPKCNRLMKTTKAKNTFSAICDVCGNQGVFFRNGVDTSR